MRILILTLGLFNGAYMLVDGIFVLVKNKYIGPDKPGPWAILFQKFDINVFRLGPLFIVFGILWIGWVYAFHIKQPRANLFGILISLATLWYLPVGTLFSVIILVTLLATKKR